ncbi:MAG: hypothetical protein R2911_32520 [Caldilineaceae bacterium]
MLGPAHNYPERPVKDNVPLLPTTLYGVYKVANEGTAQIYWQDWQVGSVGLRPYIVYGVARDQGMTSDIAKAVLATAAGRPFHIRFDGPVGLQHANDVAQMFIGIARPNIRRGGLQSAQRRGGSGRLCGQAQSHVSAQPGHICAECTAALPGGSGRQRAARHLGQDSHDAVTALSQALPMPPIPT